MRAKAEHAHVSTSLASLTRLGEAAALRKVPVPTNPGAISGVMFEIAVLQLGRSFATPFGLTLMF